MNELVSVPTSLREKIEQAERLLNQSTSAQNSGDNYIAALRARQGLKLMVEVARQSAELGALCFAVEQGYQGIQLSTPMSVRIRNRW